MSMTKVSSEKVAQILGQVGPSLRALSEENQRLKEKVAHFERKERVDGIARRMTEKNLSPETSQEELVQRLMNENDLDAVEKAIEYSAPQIKLAALSDHPGNPSDAVTAFEAAILGD